MTRDTLQMKQDALSFNMFSVPARSKNASHAFFIFNKNYIKFFIDIGIDINCNIFVTYHLRQYYTLVKENQDIHY